MLRQSELHCRRKMREDDLNLSVTNNVEFVQAVKNHPSLFNYKFANKESIERAWLEIALEFDDNVDRCREKWRTIRGSYTRYLKKRSSGKNVALYYLAPYLEFLNPFLKNTPQSSNMPSDYLSENDDEEIEESSSLSSVQDTSTKRMFGSLAKVGEDGAKVTAAEDFEPKEKKRRIAIDDAVQENSNMLFFKSLLPEINLLDRRRKNLFKIKVMTILNNMVHEQEQAFGNEVVVNDVIKIEENELYE